MSGWKERKEKRQKMKIHKHANEGEREKEGNGEGKWQRRWRKRVRGRVPRSCLALAAWAKEGCPSIPYAFPPPCVWVSSSGSCRPAPAGPAGLVTEQCFPGPWPACERRVKPASCPGWSWMAPPAQGCSEGSKPAAGASAPFSGVFSFQKRL